MRTYLIVAGLVLALPGLASAVPCTTNADCAEGELCESSGSCPPCPGDGTPCDDTCTTTSECVGYTSEAPAVAGPACATDADCPYGFGCMELQVGAVACDCACANCPPDMPDCPPCECPPCDEVPTTNELRCVFVAAACDTDADCAGGFACTGQEVCSGGGSACACPGCEPGVECPPCDCPPPVEPPPDSCVTVSAWCLPPQIACQDGAACPTDWTCEQIPMGSSACDCACACDPDTGECPPCECACPEPAPESYCLPPGWAAILDELVPVGDSGGGGTQEGEVDFASGSEPRATNGADAAGGDDGGGAGEEDSSGGLFSCSTGPGSAGLAFLALGLAALLGRRRG